MCMLAGGMDTSKNWFCIVVVLVFLLASGCSRNNDNAHTTATTFVSPPVSQVLRAEHRPARQIPAKPNDPSLRVDPNGPLLIFNHVEGATFPSGSEVVIDFSLANVKLKGDGGEFRMRYIVDDEEMQWIDRWEQVVLTGWIAGTHTIRLELIGPDGWPYRNGDYNVVTRSITIAK